MSLNKIKLKIELYKITFTRIENRVSLQFKLFYQILRTKFLDWKVKT